MPVLRPAPTVKLSKEAVVPACRPAVPRVTAHVTSQPSFIKQCSAVHVFLEENVQRALQFVTAGNPMLTRRGHRDKPFEQKLDESKMQEIYAQVRIHDFNLEQELLFFSGQERQSPTNKHLTFKARPCMQGAHCIAMTAGALQLIDPQDPKLPKFVPSPFMQICTRGELDTMYHTGVTPSEPRACLRCVRYTLGSAIISKEARGEPWPPSVVLQWFGNKVDMDQGYDSQFCLMPSKSCFNGLYLPLVQEYDDKLSVRWDQKTQGYFVDQSGLAAPQHKIREEDYPLQIWENMRQALEEVEMGPPKPKRPRTATSGSGSGTGIASQSDFPQGAASAIVN